MKNKTKKNSPNQNVLVNFSRLFWQLDRHGLGPYIFQLKKLPQLFVCLILAFFFVVLKEDSTKKIVFGYFGRRKLNGPMGEKEEKKK